jgi:hypothetical protein
MTSTHTFSKASTSYSLIDGVLMFRSIIVTATHDLERAELRICMRQMSTDSSRPYDIARPQRPTVPNKLHGATAVHGGA